MTERVTKTSVMVDGYNRNRFQAVTEGTREAVVDRVVNAVNLDEFAVSVNFGFVLTRVRVRDGWLFEEERSPNTPNTPWVVVDELRYFDLEFVKDAVESWLRFQLVGA